MFVRPGSTVLTGEANRDVSARSMWALRVGVGWRRTVGLDWRGFCLSSVRGVGGVVGRRLVLLVVLGCLSFFWCLGVGVSPSVARSGCGGVFFGLRWRAWPSSWWGSAWWWACPPSYCSA